MATYHNVEQGECLFSLAAKYGFSSHEIIRGHPNNADLKRNRPSPFILYPGDRVFIPDHDLKEVAAATELCHRFKVKSQRLLLRLRLRDRQERPLSNKRFKLKLEAQIFEGRTNSQGLLEQLIPINTERGELTVYLRDRSGQDPGLTYNLCLGHLDPIDEVEGVQGRLNNLGFNCGANDGQVGPRTEQALRDFQTHYNLPVSGTIDDATQHKLQELHDTE